MADIKVLVAVEDYPDLKGKVSLMYVHTRNVYYSEHGIDVTVLSFRAKENYEIDGIRVVTSNTQWKCEEKYDVLICHAPNLKNHYRFLKKCGKEFSKFVFFFHGHEVLKVNETYSKPYPYVQTSRLKVALRNVYDDFKLRVWRRYYKKVAHKSEFVFVSKWMLDEFLKWTGISLDVIDGHHSITYNCIGKAFEKSTFDISAPKEYDFVTIRSFLDGSKYCIDVVNELARNNPKLKFLVVGQGEFFEHYEKAPNIEWMNGTMNHKQIIDVLQKSRCALMPTRTDAQGLMMCEMASTGIPLITSDIPVCHEVFDDFKNVAFINNNELKINLKDIVDYLENGEPYTKNDKYYNVNTSQREVDLLKNIKEG